MLPQIRHLSRLLAGRLYVYWFKPIVKVFYLNTRYLYNLAAGEDVYTWRDVLHEFAPFSLDHEQNV